ncbi:MAG: hypothetical protein OEU76_02055 [Cyclobacteriaceae bacterium]|nr:hypothetical protein [Cyclobacteriaceae bacterium]
MKSFKFLTFALAFFTLSASYAQDASESVTDEELRKYAVVMDSVDHMSKNLLETITELVMSNDQISAARYNDLNKIIDDEAKLKEAEATPEEIAAVKEVVKRKEEETAKIQEIFMTLATEYVGAATYNKVKKALGSDPDTKTRYEAILAELTKDNSN